MTRLQFSNLVNSHQGEGQGLFYYLSIFTPIGCDSMNITESHMTHVQSQMTLIRLWNSNNSCHHIPHQVQFSYVCAVCAHFTLRTQDPQDS